MQFASDSLERAIKELSKLPTIGRKSAQRLALHMLRRSPEETIQLADALAHMVSNIHYCESCCNLCDSETCSVCASSKRDRTVICVVEEPGDMLAIEKTHEFSGLYHVLHGSLNPMDGIGPSDIKLKELVQRLDGTVQELILALNPNVEGEVTTQYITKIVAPLGIHVSRIARGVPIGTDLEYADEATLARAIQGRTSISE